MKRLTKVLAITSIIILVFAVILGSTMFTLIYRNAGPIESTAPNVSSDNVFTSETRSPESDTFPNQQGTTSVPGTTSAPQTTATPPTTTAPPPITTAPPPETTSPPETEPPKPTGELAFTLSNDKTYYILSGIGTYTGSEVTVPETYNGLPVREIGAGAFSYNEKIDTIVISGTVKIIRQWAFSCSSLRNVMFTSEGLEVIEERAFQYCDIINASLPETVVEIGKWAFASCSKLKSVEIPNGVKKIPEYSFTGCSSLENVVLSEGLEAIDSNAFTYCSFSKINVPNSVKIIRSKAFYECNNLETISLPDGIVEFSLWESAIILDCEKLASITIGKNVNKIATAIALGCPNLESINVSDQNQYYVSIDGVVFTKDQTTLVMYPCGKTLESYTVPNTVKVIAYGAFSENKKLSSVIFPDSVITISDSAFYECTNLKYIKWSKNINSILGRAFMRCELIESLILPESLESIGSYAFSECKNLSTIKMNDNLRDIGTFAFSDCKITELVIPDHVTNVERSAFDGCEELVRIVIGKHVEYINGIIGVPQKLQFIEVSPNNPYYKAIDNVLFSKDGKTLVLFPAGCTATTYTVPSGVTTIGDLAFANCSSIKEVILSEGITNISWQAFVKCSSLETVVISDTVSEIKDKAFYSCISLENVTLPKGINCLPFYIFDSCGKLKTINFKGTIAEWEAIAKMTYWNNSCPEITVICTDGTVTVPASNP